MEYIRKGECLQCGECCINEHCEHFKDSKCLIHNQSCYPIKCMLHPQAPPILIEGCGYYFYNITENKKVGVHEV